MAYQQVETLKLLVHTSFIAKSASVRMIYTKIHFKMLPGPNEIL